MTPSLSHALAAYSQTQAFIPQVQTVVVLLNGVVRHLDRAREAKRNGQLAECHRRIGRATDILEGLRRNLRAEVAPQLVSLLNQFYTLNIRAISKLSVQDFDDKAFSGVRGRIERMRDAWSDIDEEEK